MTSLKVKSPNAVQRLIENTYSRDLGEGVIHTTAIWLNPKDQNYITLKINKYTPKSSLDFFALNLARARADAIITSGKILREEPDLSHNLQGTFAPGLELWRAQNLKKTSRPYSIILTSGKDLDLTHPIFNSQTNPIVYTSKQAPSDLEEKTQGTKTKIVRVPNPSIRSAIEYAKQELSAKTISIEAGPSTSQELYEAPIVIDELMLSVYKELSLPQEVKGPSFLSKEQIKSILGTPRSSHKTKQESGQWEFLMYRK
jgi:riboflavin biosynthesis pyrimidine reductase